MSSFRKQETPKGVEQILPEVDFYYQQFPAQKMKMNHQNDCENLASFKVRQVFLGVHIHIYIYILDVACVHIIRYVR